MGGDASFDIGEGLTQFSDESIDDEESGYPDDDGDDDEDTDAKDTLTIKPLLPPPPLPTRTSFITPRSHFHLALSALIVTPLLL
ncbi:hypothetical protein GYMLUDRAFT_239163 [Collybiopsis luxurians FD-317 M1]|nr:hypothetical protein GYMLUDRAFT_239163 [Collybiopsis luxurians FD-317 M1]